MNKRKYLQWICLSLIIAGIDMTIVGCSSDSEKAIANETTTSEPFTQAESYSLSLDQLPKWIAERIIKAEEVGVADPSLSFSVYQCIWNGDLYYFIYSPLKSCIYCDSVFYPDGQVVEWEDSEQVHAFAKESTDWKLLYGPNRGEKP